MVNEEKIGIILILTLVMTLSGIFFGNYFKVQLSFAQFDEPLMESQCDPSIQTCTEATTESQCDPSIQTCTEAAYTEEH